MKKFRLNEELTCKNCGHNEDDHYITPTHKTRCRCRTTNYSGIQHTSDCSCIGYEEGTYVRPKSLYEIEMDKRQEKLFDEIIKIAQKKFKELEKDQNEIG